MRLTENQFVSLFDSLPTGVIYCSAVGEVVYLNRSAAAWLGISKESAMDKTLAELGLQPAAGPGSEFPFQSVLSGRKPVTSCGIESVISGQSAQADFYPQFDSSGRIVTGVTVCLAEGKDVPDNGSKLPAKVLRKNESKCGTKEDFVNRVNKIIAECSSIDQLRSGLISEIARFFNWDYGTFWCMSDNGNALTNSENYFNPAVVSNLFQSNFQKRPLFPGEGLAGKAWQQGRPFKMAPVDIMQFHWCEYLKKPDLVSAYAFPVYTEMGLAGVMEFLSRFSMPDAEELSEFFEKISGPLGLFIGRVYAEDKLRVSEARKSGILDSALDCIITIDKDSRVIDFNTAAERTFGYTAEDVIGQSLSDLIVPEAYREAHKKGMDRFLRTGQGSVLNKRIEMPAMRADGTEIQVELAISVVTAGDGPLFTAYLRDISDRKETEKRIKRLSSFPELSPNPVMEIDSLGTVLYANDAAYMALVKTGSKHLSVFFPDNWKTLFDSPEKEANYRQSQVKKIGEWYFTVSCNYIPEFGTVRIYTSDVTEEILVKQELLRERAFADRLIESAPEAMVITDPDESIIKINRQFTYLFGYTEEECRGRKINNLVVPASKTPEGQSITQKSDSSKVVSVETIRKRKDGTLIDVIVSVAPVIVDGKQTGKVGLYRDITDRKKLITDLIASKQKAEEMNRVKSYFFNNMNHELRTPFVGILGFAELLEQMVAAPKELELIRGIITSSTRMIETLNSLLALTKMEIEPLIRKDGKMNVQQAINETCQLFTPAILRKNLAFNVKLPEGTLFIQTDEPLFREVISSLLSNAVKYTDTGKIEVSCFTDNTVYPEVLRVRICDTGIGIPAEKNKLIFEEFRQASEGRSRNFEGMGLGLTLANKYIELLGGEIQLEHNPNGGSIFTVSLPLFKVQSDEDRAAAEKAKRMQTGAETSSDMKRLLLVEDDEFSQKVISLILESVYTIDIAADADAALEMVKSHVYDGLLLDINLRHGIDGVDLMELLRKRPEYKETPIIAITAFAADHDRDEFLSRGFSYYMSKPFTRAELMHLIETAIPPKKGK